MAQLARIRHVVRNSTGAVSGASVEIRKQGATINGNQAITTGQNLTVNATGAIAAGDTVQVVRSGTTLIADSSGDDTFTASALVNTTTITITGITGTLTVQDDDRIVPTTSLPTLYNDVKQVETKANPLTSSSTGLAEAWAEEAYYDGKVSGSGITTTYFEDLAVVRPVPTDTIFNVKDQQFLGGAKGNASTNDAPAIQAALNQANTDGGGIVFLPEGQYNIASSLTVYSNTTIMGVGPASIVFLTATSNVRMFILNADAVSITLRDFKINGNRANQGAVVNLDGIYGLDNDDLLIDHLHIVSTRARGIFLDINVGDFVQRATIRDCLIDDTGTDAIYLTASLSCKVVHNTLRAFGTVTATSLAVGMNVSVEGLSITDNTIIQGVSTSFAIESVTTTAPLNNNVSDNVIDGNALGGGISMPNSRYSRFSGNTIQDGVSAIGSSIEVGGSSAEELVISDNTINDGGVNVQGCVNCVIRGNTIKGTASTTFTPIAIGPNNATTGCLIDGNTVETGGDANNALIGIAGAVVTALRITNNILRNGSGHGIRLEASAGSSGIVIAGNTITGCTNFGIRTNSNANHDQVTIQNNDLRGNTGGAISHNATGGVYRFINNIPHTAVTQAITAVGNAITAVSETVELTADGNYTLTSTPTIADGYNGQKLRLINVDTTPNTITLQRESALAGSNLRLGGATRVLGQYDHIDLEFNATLGDWIETGFTDNT